MIDQTTLPARLTLVEDGYHEPLPWWKNPEVDDQEWVSHGWKAITYEGEQHFFHQEKSVVQQWLADNGYVDTGDGAHFVKHLVDNVEERQKNMDKEQKRRMANRTVIQEDEGQGDIEYTVQVSGSRVELHQTYNHNWENEDGTGPDVSHETWVMSKEVFKRFIEAAQWCIEKSEAFEAAHPSTL